MASNQVNLLQVIQEVAQALQENQTQLNQADSRNHDHGDNMVNVFSQIANAMQEKSDDVPAVQLANAAKQLQSMQSGSAHYYAQSLAQASKELSGTKTITAENAITLLQTLLGGGLSSAQTAAPAADILGSLLSATKGQEPAQASTDQTSQSPIDWLSLAGAGLEFLQSKRDGKDNLGALMDALMSNELTSQSPHRKQSGAIVAGTLLQSLGGMLSKTSKK